MGNNKIKRKIKVIIIVLKIIGIYVFLEVESIGYDILIYYFKFLIYFWENLKVFLFFCIMYFIYIKF